jgi:hypothetical protein
VTEFKSPEQSLEHKVFQQMQKFCVFYYVAGITRSLKKTNQRQADTMEG